MCLLNIWDMGLGQLNNVCVKCVQQHTALQYNNVIIIHHTLSNSVSVSSTIIVFYTESRHAGRRTGNPRQAPLTYTT